MLLFSSRPNEMAGHAVRLFALLAAYKLLFQQQPSYCRAAEIRHVRYKRTVSDFMEGLMNAVYFHVPNVADDDDDDDGPLPLPSTVIARITHVPTAGKVYKYVPVQTLKVSKVRARKIAEPKIKIKYPKKFSIKTEDSSITAVLNNNNNDPPWTLHPLPPPLSTAKTIRLEVDKAMPWALHPLPPPMKTKNYSDRYFWPDSRTRPPKYVLVAKPATAAAWPYKITKARRYNRPVAELKPSDFRPSDFKPSDGHASVGHGAGFERDRPKHYKQTTDDVKHVKYKHVDYKHVNYESPPDYAVKPDELYSSNAGADDDADGHQPEDSGHRPVYDHGGHDDHAPPRDDHYASSPSTHPRPSSEYVSHVSIVPSVQIASYSDTEMRGDGTGDRGVHGTAVCRCPVTGHRHKRDATVNGNSAAVGDSATSTTRNRYRAVGRGPSAGHASDVEIQKSHDITDNVMPMIAVASDGGEPSDETNVTTYRDDSDMFKVDFGRAVNAWAESKSTAAPTEGPRRTQTPITGHRDVHDSAEFGHRPVRRPAKEPAGYHVVTKSAVENKGGGVSFSVQTPFSVSSFTSDYPDRGPAVGYRPPSSRFGTTASSFRTDSSADEYLEPLDFEQFGFKSAALRGMFGDEDRFADGFGRGDRTSADFSSGARSRPTWPFSRDFGEDERNRGRPPTPSRYTARNRGHSSDHRLLRPSSTKFGTASDDSVLEYFQPVVVDFDRSKPQRPFGRDDDGAHRSRYFGETGPAASFSKFPRNRNPDRLRLPGGLHESTENLSRKMVFHPSTFDSDK